MQSKQSIIQPACLWGCSSECRGLIILLKFLFIKLFSAYFTVKCSKLTSFVRDQRACSSGQFSPFCTFSVCFLPCWCFSCHSMNFIKYHCKCVRIFPHKVYICGILWNNVLWSIPRWISSPNQRNIIRCSTSCWRCFGLNFKAYFYIKKTCFCFMSRNNPFCPI